ncbi:hypothetical protein MGI18_15565 [Bacillus sp. OVS6]|nr:hypothetical protein MGI18_15565 [Bacillus sp. OVS6]
MYDGKLSGFPAWNKLYKRSIFENIEFPKGRIYEDAAIMYRLFSNANKIIYLDFPLYNYIHRESSITRSKFSEKRFDAALNYKEAYSYMEKNQPEICEKLDSIYFTTLRSMIVDIIHERSIFKNYKYISEISKLIRNNNKKIIKNNMVSLKHKILAQFLAWCPILGLFFYKILFLKYNFEK